MYNIYLDDCEGDCATNEFDASEVRNFDDHENEHSEQSSLSPLSSNSSNSVQQAQEEILRQIFWECEVLLEALTLSKKGSGVWNTINVKLEVAHDELAGVLEDYVMSHSVDFSSDLEEMCDFYSMDLIQKQQPSRLKPLLLEDFQKYSTEWFLMKTAIKSLSCKVSRNSFSVKSSSSSSSSSTSSRSNCLQDQTSDHNKSSNKSGVRRRYAGASLKTMESKLRNKRKITILSEM